MLRWHRIPQIAIIASTLIASACWDEDPGPTTGEHDAVAADATTGSEDSAPSDAPPTDDSPIGGDRPAQVILPPGYAPGTPRPLLILLHGFSATGPLQDLYLGLTPAAARKGFITIIPDGTVNELGFHYWNAAPAWCCNFTGADVDDSGYLLGLVDEASRRFSVDPERVYLFGHSNGGFMAHKMACEHADRFAAIAALAGSMPLAEKDCAPSAPVSVLQIHGTLDALVLYPGAVGLYPGSDDVMRRWAGHDGCDSRPDAGGRFDFDAAALGDETEVLSFTGCEGASLALWKMHGSSHVPLFTASFIPAMLDWLLAETR